MAILPIILMPDDRLLTSSESIEVVDQDVQKLFDDMLDTMCHANGIGLAAVQVGVLKRMLIAKIPDDYVVKGDDSGEYDAYQSVGGPFFLINPVITECSDDCVDMREGCLSIPKQYGEVSRPRRIVVESLDYHGNKQVIKSRGWLARCLQHEIDHLNGKLFISYFSKLKYYMAIQKAKKIKKLYQDP